MPDTLRDECYRVEVEQRDLNGGATLLIKNKKLNRTKLLQHGFEVDRNNFIRREKILHDLELTITVDNRGNVTTKIFDADGELYTLHCVESASGSFVGAVKAEHERILNEIAAQCFDDEIFSGRQSLKIIEHIHDRFNDAPEFLWEKFPNCAVFRRKDNRKWYALIASVPKKFLQLNGAEEFEILNVRVKPEELDRIFDGEKYFRGWHMNKRSWLTMRLDDVLTDEEIFSRLEQSYRLASKS